MNSDYNQGHSFKFISLKDKFLMKDKMYLLLLIVLLIRFFSHLTLLPISGIAHAHYLLVELLRL